MKLSITPVQVADFIRCLFLFLLFFCLFSCGARKVDKRQTLEEIKTEQKDVVKTDLTIDSNTKIETRIFTNDSTKEEIEETDFIPIDHNKPAIFGKDTIHNGKITKRKIKRNKAISSNNNTIVSNDIKSTDKTKETSEKTQQSQKTETTKQVDRKQFDFLSYWWLILLIALAIYLFKKYREKIWWV